MRDYDDELSKREQMMQEAERAAPDTEEKLRHLQALAAVRRPNPIIEAEYERLRNELAEQIAEEGPRYYLDEHGIKRFAYVVQPEPIEVSVKGLEKLYEDGEISQDLLNEVAPRKVDKTAFMAACARGTRKRPKRPGITPAQMVKVARKRPGTAFVKFSEPVDGDDPRL